MEVNEELLEAAKQVLGTSTVRDTIEHAFLEVLRVQARRDEVRALCDMDGMDLADDDAMIRAWR